MNAKKLKIKCESYPRICHWNKKLSARGTTSRKDGVDQGEEKARSEENQIGGICVETPHRPVHLSTFSSPLVAGSLPFGR